MDLTTIRFRCAVEQDALDVLTLAHRHPAAGEPGIRDADMFALRQFLGWHRLRFGGPPELAEVAAKLAQFVHECGRRQDSGDGPSRPDIDRQLRAAGFRREEGLLSAVTLRRRVASVARVYESAGAGRLHDDEAISRAIALIDASNRREREMMASGAIAQARDRLLASCDDSPVGLRDRALLACWFATGLSFLALLRMDAAALAEAIRQCAETDLREVALDALGQWSGMSALATGPLFRRLRDGGRLGAPMTRSSVQQMVRRRLAWVAPRSRGAAPRGPDPN